MEGEVTIKIKTDATGIKMALDATPMPVMMLMHCANHIFETAMQEGDAEAGFAIQYLLYFGEQRNLEFQTGVRFQEVLKRSGTIMSELCTMEGLVIFVASNLAAEGNVDSIKAAFDNWEIRTATMDKSDDSFCDYINDKAKKFDTGHKAYTVKQLFDKYATNYKHN